MKIKLLFGFIAFSLLSCSSDDNESVNSNTDDNPPVEKELIKIERQYFSDQSTEVGYIDEQIYDNGLLKELRGYRLSTGNVNREAFYTHDSEGRLIEVHYEYIYTDRTDYLHQVLEYDNQGRLTSIQHNISSTSPHTYQGSTDFNYDVPNQVLRSSFQVDSFGQTTISNTFFFLDAEGNVYKSAGTSENSDYIEGTYENGNLTQRQIFEFDDNIGDYVITKTAYYTYDMETEVKGDYINVNLHDGGIYDIGLNQFGSFKANENLYWERSVSLRRANYPLQISEGGGVVKREYEFDDDGYPVIVTYIGTNNIPYKRDIITYE